MTVAAAPDGRGPVRFGVVGRGWRAEFYLRIAQALPDRFAVTGAVVRGRGHGELVERAWGVPTHRSVEAMLAAARPEVVVTSVPWAANPGVVTELVARGVPVLSETPPAPDAEGMRALWRQVGASGLVQVAEQYHRQPAHAARLALVRAGVLGEVTSAQVSSTHGYHATSLLRGLLGVGHADAEVSARRFVAPLVVSLGREGWPGEERVADTGQTVATLGFGGRSGLYDFTDGQWFHPLRTHRHVVRGTHGEIVDDRVVRLADVRTPVASPLVRRQTGTGADLEGFALDTVSFEGRVVWRNPFFPARLSDEEIAVAALMTGAGAWARGDGPAPYPLAEACQDHLLALAVEESVRTGAPVRTSRQPWADAGQRA